MSQQFFAGATIASINGGTFVSGTASTLDKLSAAAAHSALHDAPARTDESRCHPHTRTNVLGLLERWAQGSGDEGISVYWLQGGAGAGKSAVMQSLAERLAAQGLLLGSFFFFRADGSRNNLDLLIPTLIYQLVQCFPSGLLFLEPILERTPGIFKKSFQVQLSDVLVPTLQNLVQSETVSNVSASPRVFLIDGLDECSDPINQRAIIEAAAAVCHQHQIPVKFLIASRPELAISTNFRWFKEHHVLGDISLSDDPQADDDIRRFLKGQFDQIRSRHPFKDTLPPDWPTTYDVNRLVWSSSSHFIYASTVMKYIKSTKDRPDRSLQVVLGLEATRTTEPFAALDMLYHHVLSQAAHLDQVLQILNHCLRFEPPLVSHNVRVICVVLELSQEDFNIFMADMTPLVVIDSYGISVEFHHASLLDFLGDQNRSRSLYIDEIDFLTPRLERFCQLLDEDSRQIGDWAALPIWEHWHDYEDYEPPTARYSFLWNSIAKVTILRPGLATIQDTLRRYNIIFAAEVLERYRTTTRLSIPWDEPTGICRYLVILDAQKSDGSIDIFRHQLELLFDFLQGPDQDRHCRFSSQFQGAWRQLSDPTQEVKLELTQPILTLMFSGYPRDLLRQLLNYSPIHPFFRAYGESPSYFDLITHDDLLSLPSCDTHTSAERILQAAEAIAEDLRYDADTVSIQAASLAGSDFRNWVNSRIYDEHYHILSLTLRLDALQWLLPQVGLSMRLVRLSRHKISWTSPYLKSKHVSSGYASFFSDVKESLSEYASRVRTEELERLNQMIESGDVSALIEKSVIYKDLDAID